MRPAKRFFVASTLAALAAASCAIPSTHEHAAATDTRVPVRFPDELRRHTLANMRDHLATLQQIEKFRASNDYGFTGDGRDGCRCAWLAVEQRNFAESVAGHH